MFKKLFWRFLKSITGTSFEREYELARKLNVKHTLSSLLLEASSNVPYYQDLLTREGIVSNGNVNLTKFVRVPILTKDIVRKQISDLVSRHLEKKKWFYNTSGGSTGQPTRLIQDILFQKWTDATSKYYYVDLLGIEETFAKKILLWGARRDIYGKTIEIGKKIVNDALTNTVFLDTFSITETDMRRFVRIINSYKPEIIRGYATPLFELCQFIERKSLSVFSPKVVVSSAETLHEESRKKIESVFGTKVYDFYGSREVGAMAGECKKGLFHMFTFNNYLEVLDHNNQEVKKGENGRVIVTTLHNFSMPLIRYEIGDMAVLGPEKCKCGNPLPTLKKITGRIIDYFRREDGKIIYGAHFVAPFREKDWVKAFKVIQEDYNFIRILVVLKNGVAPENERRDIERKVRSLMGKDCKVKWEVVDAIPKTKTGKYLYLQSLLSE
jgi:phenylacetate-CoA ligase